MNIKISFNYRFFNCNICSYDYSGYGISEGNPSEKNMYSDINAVYKVKFLANVSGSHADNEFYLNFIINEVKLFHTHVNIQ